MFNNMYLLKRFYFIPCPFLKLFVKEVSEDTTRLNYLLLDGKLGNLDAILPNKYFFLQYNHYLYILSFTSMHEKESTSFPSLCSLLHGLLQNLSFGSKRKFYLNGLGYTLSLNTENSIIKFNLGFTHTLSHTLPKGLYIRITSHKNNQFILYGAMKQTVTSHAVSIRGYRVPDAYKGKGILYEHEVNNLFLKKGKKQMI